MLGTHRFVCVERGVKHPRSGEGTLGGGARSRSAPFRERGGFWGTLVGGKNLPFRSEGGSRGGGGRPYLKGLGHTHFVSPEGPNQGGSYRSVSYVDPRIHRITPHSAYECGAAECGGRLPREERL